MALYLLDTDTLIHAHAGHSGIAKHVQTVGEVNVATTIISAVEILRGRHEFLLKASDGSQLLRAQQLLKSSEELLASLPIRWFDQAAADEFDKLRSDKSLRKIGRADLLIASIGPVLRATVVTRNTKHFRQVPGLRIENRVDS